MADKKPLPPGYQEVPPEAFGPDCYFIGDRLYGSNGVVYDNVEFDRKQFMEWLEKIKPDTSPRRRHRW